MRSTDATRFPNRFRPRFPQASASKVSDASNNTINRMCNYQEVPRIRARCDSYRFSNDLAESRTLQLKEFCEPSCFQQQQQFDVAFGNFFIILSVPKRSLSNLGIAMSKKPVAPVSRRKAANPRKAIESPPPRLDVLLSAKRCGRACAEGNPQDH